MNEEMTEFAAAWKRYWCEGAGLRLENTPAYPLARTVAMPRGHAYETGAISFCINDLQVDGLQNLTSVARTATPETSRVRLRLTLERLILTGRCVVQVKPDPIIDLDTAGHLMDLDPTACQPVMGGAAPPQGKPDPDTEEWLDHAREQRIRLQSTPNGQKLLSLYNEHNEIYDTVFRTNHALPNLWKAGGATSEMASDTSFALQKSDRTINQKDKIYAGGRTYNGNAFVQQLNIATTCYYGDPLYDEVTGPPSGSKYYAAAKAAVSFGKGVSTSTGNTKDQVTHITRKAVYDKVDQQKGELPEVTDDEMLSLMAMGSSSGGGAATLPAWLVVDEVDRQRMRFIHESTMRQRAEDAGITGTPLFEGRIAAPIERLEAEIELALQGEGPFRPVSVRVELGAFELDVDDSTWAGEAADVAGRRLESMYFIRSLFYESLSAKLRHTLGEAAAEVLNAE